jgi:hypothetical protein
VRKWGRALSGAAAIALVAILAASARADDIPGIHATGVDDAGVVLAPGTPDPHWDITQVPAGSSFAAPGAAIVATPHRAYLPNDAVGTVGSSWVGIRSSLTSAAPQGTYVYRTTFDMTGLDPETAVLTGRVSVDNTVIDVVLNGTSLGYVGGNFRSWTDLSVTSAFVGGVNELELVVVNAGPDPSGLRVELGGTADPLPPSVLEVRVSVRPYRDDSVVPIGRSGVLPVAVLGDETFDVAALDPATVLFAGAPVAAGGGGVLLATLRDVDGDGRDDLLMLIATGELDLPDVAGATVELELTAQTTDGLDVVGSDEVTTVECRAIGRVAATLLGRWSTRGWARGRSLSRWTPPAARRAR